MSTFPFRLYGRAVPFTVQLPPVISVHRLDTQDLITTWRLVAQCTMYGISISSVQFPAWTVNIQNWIYWCAIRDICSCYAWYSLEYFAYYVEFTESCVHSCNCLHSFQTSAYSVCVVSMRLFPEETVAANTNNVVTEYMVLGCHFTSTYTDALTDQQLQCMPPSFEDMHACWADELNTHLHFCVLAKARMKLVS